jgi:hypothetical protein
MRIIENITDYLEFFKYLEDLKLDVPSETTYAIDVNTKVYDKIAQQLFNRNFCYVDLTNYTEFTGVKDGIRIQVRIRDYYSSHIAKLNNLYND